jgi:hypothetical protein
VSASAGVCFGYGRRLGAPPLLTVVKNFIFHFVSLTLVQPEFSLPHLYSPRFTLLCFILHILNPPSTIVYG